uniref:C-type lectin domain-containing protein n=1 Tax=Pygocentrus nattereri TaxID=42514 RepID=A0A3B4CSK9_PYGNA
SCLFAWPSSYSDKTYYLVKERRNWTDAKSHCEQNYTGLAVIQNEGDWQRASAAVESTTNEVWIGLHRDPEWKWSNGEDLMYFNLALKQVCKKHFLTAVCQAAELLLSWILELQHYFTVSLKSFFLCSGSS